MDDSAEDAHKIAEDIYSFVSEKVFIADQLDPGRYGDLYQLFEMAHEEEDDAYFVYEGALESYQRTAEKALTVTEIGLTWMPWQTGVENIFADFGNLKTRR